MKMNRQKLIEQARRRILADAEEVKEALHEEVNRVLLGAFQEKLLAINAASNLLVLGNPHFEPNRVLENYLLHSTADNSISPAMYIQLVKYLSQQNQHQQPMLPYNYAHFDQGGSSPIDLSNSTSSSVTLSPPHFLPLSPVNGQQFLEQSSKQISPSFPVKKEMPELDFGVTRHSTPSQSAFTGHQLSRKRKYSSTCLDSDHSFSSQVEVMQDETINNFAKENRKENLLTLQRKCLIDGCKLHFANKKTMHSHMAEAHGVLQYSCNVIHCAQSFSTQQQLTAHLAEVHSSMTSFTCPKCNKAFRKYELMSHHIYSEHALGVFQCAIGDCTFSAPIRSQVSRHFEKCHRKYQCSQCNRTFTYTGHLRTHERTHLRVKPYSCLWPHCEYLSENKSHLISHIRIRHFNLPPTKKLQSALKIEDERDPREFLYVDDELIEQTKAMFKKKNFNLQSINSY